MLTVEWVSGSLGGFLSFGVDFGVRVVFGVFGGVFGVQGCFHGFRGCFRGFRGCFCGRRGFCWRLPLDILGLFDEFQVWGVGVLWGCSIWFIFGLGCV